MAWGICRSSGIIKKLVWENKGSSGEPQTITLSDYIDSGNALMFVDNNGTEIISKPYKYQGYSYRWIMSFYYDSINHYYRNCYAQTLHQKTLTLDYATQLTNRMSTNNDNYLANNNACIIMKIYIVKIW